MVECNLAKVEVEGSNPFARSTEMTQVERLESFSLLIRSTFGRCWFRRIFFEFHILCGYNSVVECNLAKVEVAGSNPVSRSNK